jgi:uncharacterized membrane protein
MNYRQKWFDLPARTRASLIVLAATIGGILALILAIMFHQYLSAVVFFGTVLFLTGWGLLEIGRALLKWRDRMVNKIEFNDLKRRLKK